MMIMMESIFKMLITEDSKMDMKNSNVVVVVYSHNWMKMMVVDMDDFDDEMMKMKEMDDEDVKKEGN